MISWLFSAGPTGAQGTSRDLAGAELLTWFTWLEKLKVSGDRAAAQQVSAVDTGQCGRGEEISHECSGGNITLREILVALDASSLMWTVGFDITP